MLIVEDDQAIASMYAFHLIVSGWEVAVARNGQDALKLAEAEPPAVMVLDIELPLLDGIGVLRAVRSTDLLEDLPVVMLTNTTQAGAKEQTRELGIHAWLWKSSTTPAELTAVLAEIAESDSPA